MAGTTLVDRIEQALAIARNHAREGNVCMMELELPAAVEIARRARRDISAELKEIQTIAYQKALPLALSEAEKSARKKKLPEMRTLLEWAQHYAKALGQDVTSDIARIKSI